MKPTLKSFLLFAVWILVTVPLFRPFGYISIAVLVAVGSIGAEVVTHGSTSWPSSIKFSTSATQAALFAALAAAAITCMFYLVLFAVQVTGPDLSYDPPPPPMVFLRAFLCAFFAAFSALYLVRRIQAHRRVAADAEQTGGV